MASGPEFLLQQQLRAKVPTETILTDWLTEMSLSEPKPEEVISFLTFAYNTGNWRILLDAIPVYLKHRWPIHWGIFISVCEDGDLEADDSIVECVLKGARKQNRVDLLVRSTAWDMKAPEIVTFRARVLGQINEEAKRQRETLFEKLGFLRTQRMVEEEGKLLKILKRMYPRDKEIVKEWDEFQDRWARHLLSTRSEQKSKFALDETVTHITPEEQQWADVLLEDMIKISNAKAGAAYWFAINLYIMGLYTEGLKVLDYAPDTFAKDWLKTELLLKARHFVEVLTLAQELENKYVDDPETTFSVHYIRAIALKGLGQNSQAIELLRSLISIRPTYRSAHSLLSAWLEEGS